jgi:hypothetical protein
LRHTSTRGLDSIDENALVPLGSAKVHPAEDDQEWVDSTAQHDPDQRDTTDRDATDGGSQPEQQRKTDHQHAKGTQHTCRETQLGSYQGPDRSQCGAGVDLGDRAW